MDFDHPDVIHSACPEGHRFAYITGMGWGWCRECECHHPATLKAEAVAKDAPWYPRKGVMP